MEICSISVRCRALLTFIVALVFLVSCCSASDESISAAKLLGEVRRQQESIKNVHLTATWDHFENGEKKHSEEQEVFEDEYGRVIVTFANRTVYDRDGNATPAEPFYTKSLYDGKLFLVWYGDKQHGKDSERDLDMTVVVSEGSLADAEAIKRQKVPCHYAANQLLRPLENVIEKRGQVNIEEVIRGDGGKSYLVEFPDRSGNITGHIKAVVDADRGWTVSKFQKIDLSGNTTVASEVEYVNLHDNIWFPVRGSLTYLQKNHKPDNSRIPTKEEFLTGKDMTAENGSPTTAVLHFSISEQTVNADEMDEGIFQIALEPGTLVNDVRYTTGYRVDGEKMYDEKLFAMANASRAKANKFGAAEEYESQSELSENQGVSRYFVGMATAFVVSLGIMTVFVGKRRQRFRQ